MTITLKLYCPGIKINMAGEPMELPEDATVGDALRKYLEEQPGISEEILDGSYMMNRNTVTLNSPLEDGAELIAIKVINGG